MSTAVLSESEYEDDEPRLKPIDKNLPDIVEGGFRAWNRLYDSIEDETARAKFGLTGRFKNRLGQRRRFGLDLNQYKLANNPHVQMRIISDIDSVIGLVKGRFPIDEDATFKYLMMPDVTQTFTANVHLPKIEIIHDDEPLTVPLHKIPNCRFGQLGNMTVRMFLPGLYDPQKQSRTGSSNFVGKEEMRLLFDRAVQPSAQEHISIDLRRTWPPDFEAEAYRAAPHRRETASRDAFRFQATGRDIHGTDMNSWLDGIRKCVADDEALDFARGFILHVEGKGLKNVRYSQHVPPSEPIADEDIFLQTGEVFDEGNPRTKAMKAVLSGLDTRQFAPSEWFIDIATTFSAYTEADDGTSLPLSVHLDSDLHPEVIHYLSGAPLEDCARWVRRGSRGYSKDEVSHVTRLAGFRQEFDPAEGWEVLYLNVYSSEKSVSYHPDGEKRAKRTSPYLVLSKWDQEDKQHFTGIAHALFTSSETHPIAYRFESRLPFHVYPFAHHMPDLDVIEPWFFVIRNTEYWGFKWRRLRACWDVLEMACKSLDARRNFTLDMLPHYGSLIILVVYMANALVNRPDDGGHADEVHDSGCVHTRGQRGIVPYTPLGYYALHSLKLPAANKQTLPRISTQRTISRATIVYLCATEKAERNEMFLLNLIRGTNKRARDQELDAGDPWGVVTRPARRDAHPSRSNKQQRVTASVYEPVPDVFSTVPLQELQRARYSSEELDYEARDEGESTSQRISRVLYTFPVQIFRKVPNRRGLGISWLANEPFDDDEEANIHTFSDVSAPRRLFTSYTDHGRNRSKWESTVQALLPTIKEKAELGQPQGLAQLQVWEDWVTILGGLKQKEEHKAVQSARKFVSDHFAWLPYYTKRKLWVTGQPMSELNVSRFGPEKGGPWIVFNPKTRLEPLPE